MSNCAQHGMQPTPLRSPSARCGAAVAHVVCKLAICSLSLLAWFTACTPEPLQSQDNLSVYLPTVIAANTAVWQPAPGTTWQWQLTGEIDTSFDVAMYDIDLFDAPQPVIDLLHEDGRIVICYFSAGSYEEWRPDAAAFPATVRGNPLDNWPGESWLDIRQIDTLSPIMQARLDMAVQKDCDGVEPDNVDAYSNDSGFSLSAADQLTYNIWLANEAHNRGLSVGLKNDLDQIPGLLPHFDWALNEQCFQYDECDLLLPFTQAGKAVFGVEYEGELSDFCPQAVANQFSWLLKELDLGPARAACP